MSASGFFRALWQGASHLISPRVCQVCGQTLTADEELMCLDCMISLPRAELTPIEFNEIHRRLGHHAKVGRAAAWFYYLRQSDYARLLIDAKYDHRPSQAYTLGRMCAEALKPTGFFDGADVLVPVPIHWWKKLRRGYNQSMEICRGVSHVTGIPVADALRVVKSHGIQSRNTREQRFSRMTGTLAVKDPEAIDGRTVILVDDIITTGSTISEAIRAMSTVATTEIHVLGVAITKQY